MTRSAVVLFLGLLLPFGAECQQSYRVYAPHPRLWLNARHLRLLKRERERNSVRWQQLRTLAEQPGAAPERPILDALLYQVAEDEAAGGRAAAWAIQQAAAPSTAGEAELRELAVVFDWCFSLFSDADRTKVAGRMTRGVAGVSGRSGVRSLSSAVLAAIAVADDWDESEKALAQALDGRWNAEIAPLLRNGRAVEDPADRVAFLEICHAVRDNLDLDLWARAGEYFKQFPLYILLQYYPAPLAVDDVRLHRPAEPAAAKSEPARQAELGRVAELLTAAYDTSSVEAQFLQGWITHDSYRLRSPWGALYEFLWMNPYQVGLSYYSAPLQLYDAAAGRFWARSSWDDDAAWIGSFHGEVQLFADGERTVLQPSDKPSPILFPQLAFAVAQGEAQFTVRLAEGDETFIAGLEPGKSYWIKAGEGKFARQEAGKGGILSFHVETGVDVPIEMRTSDPTPPPVPPQRRRKK